MSLQFSLLYILYLQDSSMPPPCVPRSLWCCPSMSGYHSINFLDFVILNERRELLCKSSWYVSIGIVSIRFYDNRVFAENVVRLQMTSKFFSNFITVLVLEVWPLTLDVIVANTVFTPYRIALRCVASRLDNVSDRPFVYTWKRPIRYVFIPGSFQDATLRKVIRFIPDSFSQRYPVWCKRFHNATQRDAPISWREYPALLESRRDARHSNMYSRCPTSICYERVCE